MKFYSKQHQYYCGTDLHAKTMYVCGIDGEGKILVHRNIRSSPEAFRESIEPYRCDVAVAVECMFTWYWRAGNRWDEDLLLRLRSIPGIGKVLSLTILYEVHDIARFPRVQEFVSYCRLVKCAKESGGKRLGSSGRKLGNVHLKWAFLEAAVLFLRNNPKGKAYLQRMVRKHGKAKALSILAHKLGRAVYYMMARRQTFDMERFYQG